MSEEPEAAAFLHAASTHVEENRSYWNGMANDWVAAGRRAWSASAPFWGIWGVPERELEMLPERMDGLRAVELGCGTGYVSAWMARRGATVIGIDASERQLETARLLAAEHDVDIELVHGDAEATPFPDEAFDFAISEYGAAIWCDPERWIYEAWRLLTPGGRLVFLAHHPLTTVCSPLDGSSPIVERLVRPYFGLHRVDWTEVDVDPGGIEFTLPLAGWFDLFNRVGFQVEDLREPQPGEDAPESAFFATAEWARRWPTELVWKLRKVSAPSVS